MKLRILHVSVIGLLAFSLAGCPPKKQVKKEEPKPLTDTFGVTVQPGMCMLIAQAPPGAARPLIRGRSTVFPPRRRQSFFFCKRRLSGGAR